jgi:hypothetical protein
VSQPKREVDVATEHRSRRARAIKRQRCETARAADELRLAEDEETYLPLLEDDAAPAAQFASGISPFESWSVLDAVDAIAAYAMAHAEPLDMPAGMDFTLAEQLREIGERVPVLVFSGHPGAARKVRGSGGVAASRESLAVEDFVDRVDSLAD